MKFSKKKLAVCIASAMVAVQCVPVFAKSEQSARLNNFEVYAYSELISYSEAAAETKSAYMYGGVTLSSSCYQYNTSTHTVTTQTKTASGQYKCSVEFSALGSNYRIVQIASTHTAKVPGQKWTATTGESI